MKVTDTDFRNTQEQLMTGNVSETLRVIFREALQRLGIDSRKNFRWNTLMEDYVKDPRNGIPQDRRSISSGRGNLYKELMTKSSMSWRVFCKGMRFLKIEKFSITITGTTTEGETINITRFINMQTFNPDQPEEEAKILDFYINHGNN